MPGGAAFAERSRFAAPPAARGGEAEHWAMDVHRRGGGAPLDGRGRALGHALGAPGARVHTDAPAASAAAAVGADALAYGGHVGFAGGRYQPGTPAGDLLLAHELAHVAQQRDEELGAPERAGGDLEADAEHAAVGALLGRPRPPSLRSRLTLGLDSCFSSGPSRHTRQATFMDLLRDPDANRQAMLDALADDDNIDAIARIQAPLYDESYLRQVGRSSAAAREVLGRLADRLHERGHNSRETSVRDVISQLGQHTADPAAGTPQLAELDRLRRAVAGDTRHADHYKSIGLDVSTIEIYDPHHALGGRVYYDPTLDRTTTSSNITLGETGVAAQDPPQEAIYPGAIRIGPLAIQGHTDEFIRSALFHEALHRTLHLEAKRGAGSTDPRLSTLRTDLFSGPSGARANEEVEVLSRMLESDLLPLLAAHPEHDRHRNDEPQQMLNALAIPLPHANADFRRAGIARIVGALTGHPDELRRVLDILRGMPATQRAALADLEQALARLVPSTPPRRPPGGRH